MAKIRFDPVYEYLYANGYDETSFCGFLGIPKNRYKQIENGDDASDDEIGAFCECLSMHPSVLIDKS